MRVVHVAPTPFGTAVDAILGGGERYPLELARTLARHVECELVTFGSPRVRRIADLTVRTLGAPVRLHGHPAHALAPSLLRALRNADIVHVHHMHSASSGIAAVTGRLRGQRVVVTDHGLTGSSWAGLLPRLFDGFLLVSNHSAALLRAPREKTRIVFGGADVARFRPSTSPDRSDVVYVGRITPHKGIDVLIRALPPRARLIVAGSEGHDPRLPERGYPSLLRRLAEGRDVRFVGPFHEADLPSLYANAAVVVLPSVRRTCYGRPVEVSELLGLTLLESMASGTPVIASRLGGIPEIVDDGVTGFLVEPGDEDQLGSRISDLMRSRALLERLGAEARRVVVERYTWESVARRCLTAYHELLDRPRR
jgi:glycosyltransferase involved in cell wall biosynthesis